MRLTAFLTLFLFAFNMADAQIYNPDFEQSRDTLASMPQGWSSKKVEGYTVSLTSEQKHSGKQSFQIQCAPSFTPSDFMAFSQVASIKVERLKRIDLTCYIKTRDLNGNAQLWCQVWDKTDKTIHFQSSQTQSSELTGTNDWKKLVLKLTVDTNAKKLLLGGLLVGGGTAWFDTFSIEEIAVRTAESSKQVVQFSKEVIGIVKKNAIYADSVDWLKVDKDIAELSKSVVSSEDAQVIPDYLISRLRKAGDNHSFYQNKVIAQKYATGNTVPEQPYGKLLDGGIGYIYVPGFGSNSDTACVHFAQRIQYLIKDMDTKQEIKGWVVDLRYDHGGNMYPMIAGLGPLIGEGTLGYFVKPKTKAEAGSAWYYKKGSSGENGHNNVTVKPAYTLKNPKIKAAVLVGPGTASSGEMTTICFIGKPNSRLFGQPTAGYTTGNQGFKLSTGAYLYLAASYVADRNKMQYVKHIQPDVIVKAFNNQPSQDATLDAALTWLKN